MMKSVRPCFSTPEVNQTIKIIQTGFTETTPAYVPQTLEYFKSARPDRQCNTHTGNVWATCLSRLHQVSLEETPFQ